MDVWNNYQRGIALVCASAIMYGITRYLEVHVICFIGSYIYQCVGLARYYYTKYALACSSTANQDDYFSMATKGKIKI